MHFQKNFRILAAGTVFSSVKADFVEILAVKSVFSGGFHMKKFLCISLAAVLSLCVLAGCRSKTPAATTTPSTVPATRPTTAPTTRPTTPPTTAPTTAPTSPSTDMTMPDLDDMIPGSEDTIDPSNGANQETGARRRSLR